MQYLTIALELIQEQTALYEHLRRHKRILPATDEYAIELKTKHNAWMDELRRVSPNSDPIQISSEALELAVEDLRETLRAASPPNETEPFSLDAAMNYLRRTQPA